MAIDFGIPASLTNRFQAPMGTQGTPVRKPTEYWVNVGLPTGIDDDNGKFSFLSLPLGIPLDGMEEIALRGANQEFLEFRAAQNHLLAQVKEAAKRLRPGESVELKLAVQLRRVSGPPAAPSAATNRFLQSLSLTPEG